MTMEEVDRLKAQQDWPKAIKLLSELGKRVEALEKNAKVEEPAAPTSASVIPDLGSPANASASEEPKPTVVETPAPEPTPVPSPEPATPEPTPAPVEPPVETPTPAPTEPAPAQ